MLPNLVGRWRDQWYRAALTLEWAWENGLTKLEYRCIGSWCSSFPWGASVELHLDDRLGSLNSAAARYAWKNASNGRSKGHLRSSFSTAAWKNVSSDNDTSKRKYSRSLFSSSFVGSSDSASIQQDHKNGGDVVFKATRVKIDSEPEASNYASSTGFEQSFDGNRLQGCEGQREKNGNGLTIENQEKNPTAGSLLPAEQTEQNHPSSFLDKITESTTVGLHRLMMLMTSLHERVGMNELYVRKVLAEQIGLSPMDLDSWAMDPDKKSIFRLSVRKDIEPVVNYLRSQGVTGSALVQILSTEPAALKLNVEEDLVPLCDLLKLFLDDRAMGALIRNPGLALISSIELKSCIKELMDAGFSDMDIGKLLWQNPKFILKRCQKTTAKS